MCLYFFFGPYRMLGQYHRLDNDCLLPDPLQIITYTNHPVIQHYVIRTKSTVKKQNIK